MDGLTDWLIYWFIDSLIDWLIDGLVDGSTDWLTDWLCVGLSAEHATDVTVLTAELDKVDRQLRELTMSARMRYAPKQHRDELRCELESCMAEKDKIQAQVDCLRYQVAVLRTALEAADAYRMTQLPQQTVGDAVLLALRNNILYGMSDSMLQCDFRFDLFFSFSFSFPVIFSF